MGNLEGVCLPVLSSSWRALEMEHLLLNQFALLFWIQIMSGAWVWGQSGTSMKDQGSHYLASEYGAERACFKAKVHWDRKDSNPITTLTLWHISWSNAGKVLIIYITYLNSDLLQYKPCFFFLSSSLLRINFIDLLCCNFSCSFYDYLVRGMCIVLFIQKGK